MFEDTKEDEEDKINLSIKRQRVSITFPDEKLEIKLPYFDQIDEIPNINLENFISKSSTLKNKTLKNHLDEELKDFKKKKEKFGNSTKYQYRLAKLYNLVGDYELEKDIISTINNGDKKNIIIEEESIENTKVEYQSLHLLLKECISLFKDLKFQQARTKLISLHAKYGCHYKINLLLAISNIYNSDFKRAISFLKELIQNGIYEDDIFYYLSLAYYFEKQYAKAYMNAFIGLEINWKNRNLLILYYNSCLKNKTKINISYFENYNDLFVDTQIIEILAKYYFYECKYSISEEKLKSLLEMNYPKSLIWNNLALIQNKRKDYKKTKIFYDNAIKYADKKSDFNIISNYFNFLYRQKEYEEIVNNFIKYRLNLLNNDLLEKAFETHYVYLNSLLKLQEKDAYIEKLNQMYDTYTNDIIHKTKIVNNLLCIYSHENIYTKKLDSIFNEADNCITLTNKYDDKMRTLNNLIFCKIEKGITISEQQISDFRSKLDKNPFYNATYGLYLLRSGNLSKGLLYYEKSLQYTASSDLKNRLRDKRDYERAYYFYSIDNFNKSKSLLNKLISKTKSDDVIYTDMAKSLLKSINQNNRNITKKWN